MGKHVQWTTYKGMRILVVNGAGLREPDLIAAYEEFKQELLKDRTGPSVLIDLSNTTLSTKAHDKAKEVAAATKAEGIPDGPCAVVGLSTLARAVAQLLQRSAYFTDSVDKGKEWLLKQDHKVLRP